MDVRILGQMLAYIALVWKLCEESNIWANHFYEHQKCQQNFVQQETFREINQFTCCTFKKNITKKVIIAHNFTEFMEEK